MPGQVADLRDILQGKLNLCTEFLFYLPDIPLVLEDRLAGVGGVGRHHGIEVSVFVGDTRTMGEGTPFDVLPFTCDDEMEADVEGGIRFQHLDGLGEPGSNRHHLDRLLDAIAESCYTSLID